MGQALHFANNLVSQVGTNTLEFNTQDRITSGTLALGGANTTQLDLATHANTTTGNLLTGAGMTALNIGTGMGAGDTITIGSGGAGGCAVLIDGDLEVNGAELVHGDSTFEGDIQLGDAVGDSIDVQGTISFSTGVIGDDLPFSHASRQIVIANGATQADLTLKAADNSVAAGGDIVLTPGAGATTDGNVRFGQVGGTTDVDFQIFANTGDGTAEAGIRWADATGRWQVQYDGTAAWYNILTSNESAPVTAGTDQYQHLEWDGTDSWDPATNYTLPNDNTGAAAVTREIVVETKAFANGDGDNLFIRSGHATPGGTGVASSLVLGAGQDNAASYNGNIFIGQSAAAARLASHLYIGHENGGGPMIHVNSDSAGSEYTSANVEWRFGGETACDIHFDYGGNGSRAVTDLIFGGAANRQLYIEDGDNARSLRLRAQTTTTAATAAGEIFVSGGSSTTGAAGHTNVYGGIATTTGTGGDLNLSGGDTSGAGTAGHAILKGGSTSGAGTVGNVYIRGGSTDGGPAYGNVYLADQNTTYVYMGAGTNGIQFDLSTQTLVAIGTGSINLDTTNSRLEINGGAVVHHANMTATNFAILFNGGDASSLHTHAGLSSSDVSVSVTTDGSSTTFVCYITSTDAIASAQANAIGTSKAIGVRTAANTLMLTGVTTIQMEGALTASIGDDLWLSATQAGAVTNVAPSTAGQFLVYVGQAKTAGNTPSVYLRPERPLAL